MKNEISGRLKLGLLLSLLMVIDGSCGRDPFNVDISGIQTEIEIIRFEKVLFSVDPALVEELIPEWEKDFGIFFNHFCYLTRLGTTDDPGFAERLRAFISDRNNYLIFKRTLEVFPDLAALTAELNNAFRHYLHYFPQKTVPDVYTFISGFGQSAISDDSLLAIGLDKYLGRDEPLYRQTGIYNYLIANMHPGKIVSDCMNFWGETEFVFNDSVNNLIANMIYRGRLLYFTSAMVPDQPDSLKWGFGSADLTYLGESEKSMWAFLIEHKLLFNTDRFTIDQYILEGPFTKDFGRNSPARAAVWLGYRIVASYMSRNPDVKLKELMEERDYQKILNGSRYNP
jgi:hypothetical protein